MFNKKWIWRDKFKLKFGGLVVEKGTNGKSGAMFCRGMVWNSNEERLN